MSEYTGNKERPELSITSFAYLAALAKSSAFKEPVTPAFVRYTLANKPSAQYLSIRPDAAVSGSNSMAFSKVMTMYS